MLQSVSTPPTFTAADIGGLTEYTVAAWIRSTADGDVFLNDSSGVRGFYITVSGSTIIVYRIKDAANFAQKYTTANCVPASTWCHLCVTFSATNPHLASSITVYINGANVSDANEDTSATMTTTDGEIAQVGPFGSTLRMAESAIWTGVLSAAEISALAKGFKPFRVGLTNLLFYAPMLGGLQELVGGATSTAGNATFGGHEAIAI